MQQKTMYGVIGLVIAIIILAIGFYTTKPEQIEPDPVPTAEPQLAPPKTPPITQSTPNLEPTLIVAPKLEKNMKQSAPTAIEQREPELKPVITFECVVKD
jgi:hypothetical protein